MSQMKQDMRVVSGYCFLGEDDAELARQEERKIAYMDKHMDYSVPEKVLMLYNRSIDERIFKTPVGYDYLRRMQDFLLNTPEIDADRVSPIKLYVNFQPTLRSRTNPTRERVKAPKPKKKADKFIVSLVLNIALVLAVVGMFAITMKSDNPNILNYENAILNKYASWEQELSGREQVIREKERELGIQNQ